LSRTSFWGHQIHHTFPHHPGTCEINFTDHSCQFKPKFKLHKSYIWALQYIWAQEPYTMTKQAEAEFRSTRTILIRIHRPEFMLKDCSINLVKQPTNLF
jgi:hypothetical protein